MANEKTQKPSISERLINNIKTGDRVIWLVVIMLMLISMVAIFSSTSTLAMKAGVTRWTIFAKHIALVAGGLLLIVVCSIMPSIQIYRSLASIGFIGSLALLIFLDCGFHIGDIVKVPEINGAKRAIMIKGFGLQVFEIVKIAMVMYLAWALQAYETHSFKLAERLSSRYPDIFGWMASDKAQLWIYIFMPILVIVVLTLPGSTGSAILCGIVMLVTIWIGGIKWTDLYKPAIAGCALIVVVVSVHILSSGRFIPRMETVFSRTHIALPYPNDKAREDMRKEIELQKLDINQLEEGTPEFTKYIDKNRQAAAAEIAIVEGGRLPFGKGPGKSTQKYKVPVMYEDYIFSMLVEEYGLLAGIIIIVMYMSLFARGGIIVSNSTNRYAQACVGGLVFLITFQALFHILINCNIGVVTGQTLPLISHGRCSFIFFCFAFGEILCISRMANMKIKKEQKEVQKLIEQSEGGDMVTDEIDN